MASARTPEGWQATTASAAETERLGARLAAVLAPGDVVLVAGELGAGKTTFVRGAARALGVTDPVTSPTYVVGQLYAAPSGWVSHLDLYRLAGLETEDPDLLDAYFGADRVSFVEWPEQAGDDPLPLGDAVVRWRVVLDHAGADARAVAVTPAGRP